MRRQTSRRLYTAAGIALLFFSALILAETIAVPHGLIASLFQNRANTRIATYVPRYKTVTPAEAETLAAPFAPIQGPIESDTAFFYTCADGTLTIDKYTNRLYFESSSNQESTTATSRALTTEEAVTQATAILNHCRLHTASAQLYAEQTQTAFVIRFATKLGGLDNLAFPATVTLDRAQGKLLSLEAYTFAYDRLSSCRLKSPQEALADYQSSSQYPSQSRDALRELSNSLSYAQLSFTLVYALQDSILQPAYLLEVMQPDGTPFQHVLPASLFQSNP